MAISVKAMRELLDLFPDDALLDLRKNGWGYPALVVALDGEVLPLFTVTFIAQHAEAEEFLRNHANVDV